MQAHHITDDNQGWCLTSSQADDSGQGCQRTDKHFLRRRRALLD